MDRRARLVELLVGRSVRLGDFTLAGGSSSSYYVDARRTTMTAEGQFLVGHLGYEMIARSGWAPTHVGGLTMGADPVAYAIAHRSWLRGEPLDAFSVRKEPKGHGTGQQVEGGLPEGARCIVVEDAMTTGGSALRAVEVVREHGAEVVGALTVVDREEGARQKLAEAGLALLAICSGPELLERAREESARSRGAER